VVTPLGSELLGPAGLAANQIWRLLAFRVSLDCLQFLAGPPQPSGLVLALLPNTPFLGRRFRDQAARRLVAGRFVTSLQAATASSTVPPGIDAASRVIAAH
jgi:hypothetical protein